MRLKKFEDLKIGMEIRHRSWSINDRARVIFIGQDIIIYKGNYAFDKETPLKREQLEGGWEIYDGETFEPDRKLYYHFMDRDGWANGWAYTLDVTQEKRAREEYPMTSLGAFRKLPNGEMVPVKHFIKFVLYADGTIRKLKDVRNDA